MVLYKAVSEGASKTRQKRQDLKADIRNQVAFDVSGPTTQRGIQVCSTEKLPAIMKE